MTSMIKQCGIEVGQIWTAADGSGHRVKVVDIETYARVDDVVIVDLFKDGLIGEPRRIDAYKLACVRYCRED